MASSDDEEFQKAIALSLESLSEDVDASLVGTSLPQPPVEVAHDNSTIKQGKIVSSGTISPQPLKAPEVIAESQTPLNSLDRRAMEEERLARAAARMKRRASISPPPMQREPKRQHIEVIDLDAESPPKIQKTTTHNGDNKPRSPLQYPRGVVKKTWAFGHERSNDIKIEEVLQRADLKLAVLSAFQWDMDWLFRKIDIKITNVILVMQAKEKADQDRFRSDAAGMPNLRLCFPPMPGQVNCMHSKLMLLSHPRHLRVVVPSANLVSYDWGESGIMENSVFLIDLPLLEDGKRSSVNELTAFGKELMHFLKAMGLEGTVRDSILKFDFSATDHLAFVHTVGGAHYGEDLKRTGYPGLSRAVRTLGLQSGTPFKIDFCASSIGSLSMGFLTLIYKAARGLTVDEVSESGKPKPAKKKKLPMPPADITNDANVEEEGPETLCDDFRIYFPTHDTVASSKGGTNILFARGQRRNEDGKISNIAWMYTGSANLSESAWGKLVVDKSKKEAKLNCRNWECGVLMAVPTSSSGDLDDMQSGKFPGMEVFREVYDVPFQYPGAEYGDRKPWFIQG
ncbi:hypothetical protein H2199_006719 [Coniosporium tulheliwenetii]|uniref:Uncharacterized protein n=1 Tax=Coniosporium tulheliwenetii TaxID=3383036 RepID=A0ACC2YUL5_9PEZI|nr:hypothetical protein H2199_006719 [Cladosporium sp. JES 115]